MSGPPRLSTLLREAPHLALADQLHELITAYAQHDPVRTITVVGNAPLAPSRERAAIIDASDAVFRCNSFVLDDPGDEPALGTRCDVAVIAYVTTITPYTFRDYRSRLYLVPVVGYARRLTQHNVPLLPPSWPEDLGEVQVPNDGVGAQLYQQLAGDVVGKVAVPTTGTVTAYLARTVFPDAELNLAGFSFLDDPTQRTWRHQYGLEVPVHPAHPLRVEAAMLRSWVADGRARVLA